MLFAVGCEAKVVSFQKQPSGEGGSEKKKKKKENKP
jgi:hypothetical protein